uniref:Uncharacterized protein n=1 Tax=Rhizophora mucronata TaxID=61149 RepID=A0A2P2IV91_RHIMU
MISFSLVFGCRFFFHGFHKYQLM